MNFKIRNKFLDNARINLFKRARKEGGSAEVSRLQTEISKGVEIAKDFAENFAKGLSREECLISHSKMVKGELDLKKTLPKEVELLMGN